MKPIISSDAYGFRTPHVVFLPVVPLEVPLWEIFSAVQKGLNKITVSVPIFLSASFSEYC